MLKNVLVIDGDIENYKEIQANLQDATTNVHYADTVQAGLHQILINNYCLIIMDVLLSVGGGHDVIMQMREHTPMPILALSEQSSTQDKVLALNAGADDFLEKPYDMDECLARARALLRRYTELNHISQRSYALVCHEDMIIDTARRVVVIEGREIQLVHKEYELLVYFIKNRGIVLAYEQIYEAVWHESYFCNNKTIIFHVGQLRRKLGSAVNIQSIPRIGYCLKLNAS